MASWVAAAAAALALALILYAWREGGRLVQLAPLVVLRAGALTVLLALILDAPAGRRHGATPIVGLDVSASWMRAGDSTRWRAALQRVASLGPDSLLLFGDSVWQAPAPSDPDADASRAGPLVERALGAGRPAIIVTDGELDDPGSLRSLPAGSRVEVISRSQTPDIALMHLDAPRALVSGDSADVSLTLRAGGETGASRLTLALDGRTLLSRDLEPFASGAERQVVLRVPMAAPDGAHLLAASVQATGDAESRNDTVTVPLEIARAAGAVLASTAPDLDARFMAAVLRGAVSLPTRAYFRVAPQSWRLDGALTPVPESEVRRAVREAPLAVLHGDTAFFGRARSVVGGALVLAPAVTDSTGEWFPVGTPMSPIASALSGLPWDSLPPISAPAIAPRGDWEGLVIARSRQFERRPALVGSERARREVVVGGAGFWRWQFRGGRAADAYAALFGAAFDWLTARRADARPAVPADPLVRAGERIRWAKGTTADSIVPVVLRRRGGAERSDTLMLPFPPGASFAESAPLEAGVFDVVTRAGNAVLVVNASRELLPRDPTVRAGLVGGQAALGDRPRARDRGWLFLLMLGLLGLEWILRRRMGLR